MCPAAYHLHFPAAPPLLPIPSFPQGWSLILHLLYGFLLTPPYKESLRLLPRGKATAAFPAPPSSCVTNRNQDLKFSFMFAGKYAQYSESRHQTYTVETTYVVSAHHPPSLRSSDVVCVVKANEATVSRGSRWPLSEGWLPGEPGD